MIWIVLFLCLGIGAFVGYFQGPIRGVFTLLGLTLGAFLAEPLSPIIKPLLPLLGVKSPLWQHVLPAVICFVLVVILCSIGGAVLHRKITVGFKYGDEDDARHYRWERFHSHVGICTGLFVGAFYFFVLMLPIYIGGYFTLELTAKNEGNPTSVKMINGIRTEMQKTKIDHVLAAYDPTPESVYLASDTLALVLENPLLESRLSHYPVFMSLSERPEFGNLAKDLEFQKMFQTRRSTKELLAHPKVAAIVNDPAIVKDLVQLVGSNLSDLNEYIKTGKSPKYDGEKILGTWTINPSASVMQDRKKINNASVTQLLKSKYTLISQVLGLMLTTTIDNKAILKKENPADPQNPTVVYNGTWKKNGEKYEITLPGNNPETVALVFEGDDCILLPKDGTMLVMDRE